MRRKRFRAGVLAGLWAAAFLATVGAESWAPASGKWERLEGCRLVEGANADGDSFVVRQGGREFRFRLYAVDAPETAMTYKDRVKDQARHFGITRKQAVAAGHEAERLARRLLAGSFTVETCWQDAKGSGPTARYFAVITAGGRDLAEQLAAAGLARVYGFTPDRPGFSEARLRQMQERARALKLGAYGLASVAAKPAPTKPGVAAGARPGSALGAGAGARPSFSASRLPPSLSSFPGARPNGARLDGRIDVNTATEAELMTVPGLGGHYARALIAGRPYENLAAITRVRGIGPKKLERLTPYLVASGR